MIELTRTVDVAELAWTAIALAGFVLALELHREAARDKATVNAAEPARPTERRIWRLECELVAGDVATARWIITQEIAGLTLGLLSMLTPPPPGGRSPYGWAVIGILLIYAAILPIRLLDHRRRRGRLGLGDTHDV